MRCNEMQFANFAIFLQQRSVLTQLKRIVTVTAPSIQTGLQLYDSVTNAHACTVNKSLNTLLRPHSLLCRLPQLTRDGDNALHLTQYER